MAPFAIPLTWLALTVHVFVIGGRAASALSGPFIQTTGYLSVPAASLYYETYGTGPLLLFIAGANVLHEPPALKLLPDAQNLTKSQEDVYAVYRAAGIPAAFVRFLALYGMGSSVSPGAGTMEGFTIDARESPFLAGNLQYWFERELLQYPLRRWDLDTIGRHKDKLVLACGRASNTQGAQYRANVVMAENFGLNITLLAGTHVGYVGSTMTAWANDLLRSLAGRT